MDTLTAYKRKRNFAVTAEPNGGDGNESGSDNTFVVQYHEARRKHYDLRLSYGGVLLSWAVPKGPSYNPRDKRLAVKVEDHPLAYARFEGTIPKGEYGGGTVMLWDEGTYEPLCDFAEGLESGSLKFTLNGERMRGSWALVRMATDEKGDNWLLIKENDSFKKEEAGIAQFTVSVASGRTIAEIAAQKNDAPQKSQRKESQKSSQKAQQKTRQKNPFAPRDLEFALCKYTETVPDGDDRLYEVKYDGYRIAAFGEGGAVRLYSRNKADYTEKFAALADELAAWADRAFVLDCELAAPDENGKTDFQALQAAEKNGGNAVLIAFDLLALDGEDLRPLPLIERKEKLAVLAADAPECLRVSAYVRGRGRECAEAAQKFGLEGIVGKRADAPYRAGRGDWIKYKCYKRHEFVLGGYTRTPRKSDGIGALLLGYNEGGKRALRYAGRAGTGLGRAREQELLRVFSEYAADASPFASSPRSSGGETLCWLKPELVAEVQFAEWTNRDRLRQASFKGLRADKSPREVVREDSRQIAHRDGAAQKVARPKRKAKEGEKIGGVWVTHPDKIVYPDCGITKRDVMRYYERVADRMIEEIGGRILSVVRCHNGVGGGCFFNKHPAPASRATPIAVPSSDGGEKTYFYLIDKTALLTEVQLGALEFHVWGSKVDSLEFPDRMVFDLDPDEGLPLCRVREGAREVKKALEELKLTPTLKTSGGKGYHVTVQINHKMTWDAFRAFARDAAKLLEQERPDLFTSNIRKEKRKGKIYLDWGRNTRGATSVAAYSLRARPGAKISLPIEWAQLDEVKPDGVTIKDFL